MKIRCSSVHCTQLNSNLYQVRLIGFTSGVKDTLHITFLDCLFLSLRLSLSKYWDNELVIFGFQTMMLNLISSSNYFKVGESYQHLNSVCTLCTKIGVTTNDLEKVKNRCSNGTLMSDESVWSGPDTLETYNQPISMFNQ